MNDFKVGNIITPKPLSSHMHKYGTFYGKIIRVRKTGIDFVLLKIPEKNIYHWEIGEELTTSNYEMEYNTIPEEVYNSPLNKALNEV